MQNHLQNLCFENLMSYWQTLSKPIGIGGDEQSLILTSTESTIISALKTIHITV